jgi:valyl-tRNA synthetase
LRAEKNIKPGKLIPALLVGGAHTPMLKDALGSIASLAFLDLDTTTLVAAVDEIPSNDIALVAGPVEIYLPLSGLVNLAEEKKRLKKELDELRKEIQRLEELLAGPFAEKAPQQVVQQEKEKLTGYRETSRTLEDQLSNLKGQS